MYLIATFPSLDIDIEKYPAINQHLLDFGYNRLKQTGGNGARKKTNNKWFETQDSISYWEDFSRPKIVWGNLNLSASYTIAKAGMFINAPCTMIVPANKFLLAVLNSKLADYYIRTLGVARNGGYFEYKPMFVEQLPVPEIDVTLQIKFEKMVDTIFESKEHRTPTLEIEQKIDELICDVYHLNNEERNFILKQNS